MSVWISAGALIISACALTVSVLSYRASGPRVSASAHIYMRGGQPTLAVLVYNQGRSPISIKSNFFHVFYRIPARGNKKSYTRISPDSEMPELDGPSLPYRLEGNDAIEWNVPIPKDSTILKMTQNGQPVTAKLYMFLGNGRQLVAPIQYTFFLDSMPVRASANPQTPEPHSPS